MKLPDEHRAALGHAARDPGPARHAAAAELTEARTYCVFVRDGAIVEIRSWPSDGLNPPVHRRTDPADIARAAQAIASLPARGGGIPR